MNALESLGFVLSAPGSLHGWELRHGPLELNVSEGENRFFARALNFSGQFNDGRMMQLIEFTTSPTLSHDELLALLSYNLRGLPIDKLPEWVAEGLSLGEYLPWRKDRP